MTWARTTQTGSGKLRFRISIEGIPVDAVTHVDMVTEPDIVGAYRANGLSVKGVKLAQEANITQATIEAKGVSLAFVDIDQAWSRTFNTIDMQETWLEADMTSTADSLTVKSTAGFPSEGLLWLNSECMFYTDRTATAFLGVFRARFGTMAQAHYLSTGAALRAPQVTSQPVLWTGRRIRIFVYGAGDSPQGGGTQIWLGLLTGEPRMEGPSWYLNADPISSLLDQEIGSDLGDPVSVRGVAKFGFVSVLSVYAKVGTGGPTSINPGDVGVQHRPIALGPSGTNGAFYETQQDFVNAVSANLASALSSMPGITANIRCVVDQNVGYRFDISNGANADAFLLRTWHEEPIEPRFDGPAVLAFTANTTVSVTPSAYPRPGAGFEPRGSFRIVNLPQFNAARLFLSGVVSATSSTTAAQVSWEDTGSDGDFSYGVVDFDLTQRYIELGNESPSAGTATRYYTPNNAPKIKLGRTYDDGFFDGTHSLMSTLQSACPDGINTGTVPSIQSSDWNSTEWFAAYVGGRPLGKTRTYSSVEPVKVSDFVSPDLQLAGLFLAFDSIGRMTVRKLRLAASTEPTTFEITRDNLLTDEGLPVFERGGAGMFNTLSVQDGYVASRDEHTQPAVIVRDVASFGQSPVARTLRIEPKSGSRVMDLVGIREIAELYLGVFGGRYGYVHCSVPLTALNGESTTLGATVSISTDHIPNATGTRGVSRLTGLVVSRAIDLYGARIDLKILVTLARVGGYALGSRVSSQTNVSGDTWDITVNAAYFAAGDNAENHLGVNDRVTVYRWNNATGGAVPGTVQSVTGNVVRVLFDSTWTPSSDQWALASRTASDAAVTSNMKRYVYLASTDARISYGDSTSEPAWSFSP